MLLFWPHPTSQICVSHPLPPYKSLTNLPADRFRGLGTVEQVFRLCLRLQWRCWLGLASYEISVGSEKPLLSSFIHVPWEKCFMLLGKIFKKLKEPPATHTDLSVSVWKTSSTGRQRDTKLTANWGRGQYTCLQVQKAVCSCLLSLSPAAAALSHLVSPVPHKLLVDPKSYLQKCTPELEGTTWRKHPTKLLSMHH